MLTMIVFAVSTIALTKPEKAKMVESMLIQMAQRGQIQEKVIFICVYICCLWLTKLQKMNP